MKSTKILLKINIVIAFCFTMSTVSLSQDYTWVKGSNTLNQLGVYGTKGVASSANTPGARSASVTWKDASGNLWLFGGDQNNNLPTGGVLNDLWKYNPNTNEWTWMSGSNIVNQQGIYGTKGVPDPANIPGSRYGAVSWTDAAGNFWLFGGFGNDGVSSGGKHLNDLWKYDPANNMWTWVNGNPSSLVFYTYAIYGTQGIAAPTNRPGGRNYSVSWIDASGNFWLFGGFGRVASGGTDFLNDLWKYNPTSNEWTWVKGGNILNQNGTYGTQGVSAPANTPGARLSPVAWTDASGNLCLFSGSGYSASGYGLLNDLWKYNPAINEWTWVKGSNATNQNGNYGTQGVSSPANIPGARSSSKSWSDACGNLYLFGGSGMAASGGGNLNDLWKYSPFFNEWTWIKGSNATNQNGNYGTQGVSAPANTPGERYSSVGWSDAAGNLWLFGGRINADLRNDLWKYNSLVVPAGGTTTSALFGGVTNIVNKDIYVLGPLKIDNNMTFSGCNLVAAPSVGISLTTGNLILNNQTHIYACSTMWNGISVTSGRTLSTSGSVFIEDALQGITIAQGAVVTIDQTIFNRNLTAIELTANTSASSPLSISNSIITSRTIPFNSVPSLNLTYNAVSLNIAGGTPYTASVLKAPYNNRKGCYGIKATGVSNLTIGVSLVNQTNYFDAIMAGIHLTQSNAVVYNNRFQYLLGYPGVMACLIGSPCYYEKGYGIIASGNATGNYAITIGGLGAYQSNTFYNTFGAINVVDYKSNTITNNTIDNSVTGPFGGMTTNYGNTGIYLRAAVNQLVTINSNSLIRNCATAISVNRTAASCATTQGITIDNNTITANASGYCVTGINMQDITGSAGSAANSIKISNNNITETQNGITAANVKSGLSIFHNNNLGIAYHATALRYGIRITNCQSIKLFENLNIHCTTPNIYTNASANVRGIYLLNTTGNTVSCNQVDNVTQALMFEGNCPSLVVSNIFNSAYYGLYMKNNAVIGTQGNSMYPSDNVYYGPFASNYQTFTDNVSNVNTNSIFYVRSNGSLPTVPSQHGGTNPYVNSVGIISTVSNAYQDCFWLTRIINPNGDQALNRSLVNEVQASDMTNIHSVTSNLYPNPSNGKMLLDYSIPENETGVLTITDIMGKTISAYAIRSSETQLSISEDELLDGIYFYEINVSNGFIKRDKLIIVK
jgi:N-acetylneuraminic acid mutarotase